jgi:hypothetical protein
MSGRLVLGWGRGFHAKELKLTVAGNENILHLTCGGGEGSSTSVAIKFYT